MKDETYVFISDVKEKGSIGRSARHRKTHAGKGGRVRLPSDNLSKKELQKMSGECKSYRLNEPMAWKEFRSMPDDIKVTYIKLIRQKFNAPVTHIAKMMGITEACLRRELQKFGMTEGKGSRTGKTMRDKEGFYAWANVVNKLPTPVPEEEPIQEPVITCEEPEAFVEEDLPFDIVPVEEPDHVPVEKYRMLDAEICALNHRTEELLKVNEELIAVHENDKKKIAWLENRVNDLELERHILEKQMDVVRMIFGGN